MAAVEGGARAAPLSSVDLLTRCPAVALDVVTDGRFLDIVAVRFGGDARFVAVASPDHLARRGRPRTPDDLGAHTCIRVRMPSGTPYRREFARHGVEIALDVPGAPTLDHPGLMVEAAAAGLGIACLAERWVAPLIVNGALAPVLEDRCALVPGLFLCDPGHRDLPAALRTFIDPLETKA